MKRFLRSICEKLGLPMLEETASQHPYICCEVDCEPLIYPHEGVKPPKELYDGRIVKQIRRNQSMKVYISGAITNVPDYKEKFNAAEEQLQGIGLETVNPARLDLGNTATWEDYMKRDVKLLADCDGIFMIKGWRRSKGARLERYLAKKLNLIIMYER